MQSLLVILKPEGVHADFSTETASYSTGVRDDEGATQTLPQLARRRARPDLLCGVDHARVVRAGGPGSADRFRATGNVGYRNSLPSPKPA